MRHYLWIGLFTLGVIINVLATVADFSTVDTSLFVKIMDVFLITMCLFFVVMHVKALVTGEDNGW
jgi:hypothetical protein